MISALRLDFRFSRALVDIVGSFLLFGSLITKFQTSGGFSEVSIVFGLFVRVQFLKVGDIRKVWQCIAVRCRELVCILRRRVQINKGAIPFKM